MNKVVFIAIPSKGTVVNGALSEEFLKFFAKLFVDNPDITFIAPMIQDYQILKFMNVAPVWENWGNHCRTLIERSDEVWVLMYDGWDTSVGVTGERRHAYAHQKPIYFVNPD